MEVQSAEKTTQVSCSVQRVSCHTCTPLYTTKLKVFQSVVLFNRPQHIYNFQNLAVNSEELLCVLSELCADVRREYPLQSNRRQKNSRQNLNICCCSGFCIFLSLRMFVVCDTCGFLR